MSRDSGHQPPAAGRSHELPNGSSRRAAAQVGLRQLCHGVLSWRELVEIVQHSVRGTRHTSNTAIQHPKWMRHKLYLIAQPDAGGVQCGIGEMDTVSAAIIQSLCYRACCRQRQLRHSSAGIPMRQSRTWTPSAATTTNCAQHPLLRWASRTSQTAPCGPMQPVWGCAVPGPL